MEVFFSAALLFALPVRTGVDGEDSTLRFFVGVVGDDAPPFCPSSLRLLPVELLVVFFGVGVLVDGIYKLESQSSYDGLSAKKGR